MIQITEKSTFNNTNVKSKHIRLTCRAFLFANELSERNFSKQKKLVIGYNNHNQSA